MHFALLHFGLSSCMHLSVGVDGSEACFDRGKP